MTAKLPDSVSVLLDALEAEGVQTLPLYVIQSAGGRFATGGSYWREQWTDQIGKAKVYVKLGTARSKVTALCRAAKEGRYSELTKSIAEGVPTIVQYTAVPVRQLNEADRVDRVLCNSQAAKDAAQERARKKQIRDLERERQRVDAEIAEIQRATADRMAAVARERERQ